MSLVDILKATQLTRGGRLMDATRLIQSALGLGKPPRAHAAAARNAADGTHPEASGGSRPSGRDAARAGDDVVDAPFREVLRKPANEAVFTPHEVQGGPTYKGRPTSRHPRGSRRPSGQRPGWRRRPPHDPRALPNPPFARAP